MALDGLLLKNGFVVLVVCAITRLIFALVAAGFDPILGQFQVATFINGYGQVAF